MTTFEGDPRNLREAAGIIVQSITTTGYGQDAPWNSTFMQILVIVAQFTGVAYLFIALPLFIVPWLRDIFIEPQIPNAVADIEDHVVITGTEQVYSALIEDLETRDQDYLVVERDGEQAKQLYQKGQHVITGDLSTIDSVDDANIPEARAVVIDNSHTDGIGATLTIRSADNDVSIISLIDEPAHSQYLRFAGASTVLSPKHRLGKSLADKAQNVIVSDLDDIEGADIDLEIGEFPVTVDSSIYGRRFTEFTQLTASRAHLIGAWVRGEFVTSFNQADRIGRNTVLVIAGTAAQLNEMEALTNIECRRPQTGPVVILGHGIIGSTADTILQKAGVETTTVDREAFDPVDVVADATTVETFHTANVTDAATTIISLSDDEAAVRATLIAAHVNPDMEILVAANDVRHTNKLYRAGADYVLSYPKVAARMTTLDIFDETVMALSDRIQVTHLDAVGFEGMHPRTTLLDNHEDITLIGILRNGQLHTALPPDFEISADDTLIVAGTGAGINELQSDSASSPPETAAPDD